MTSYLRLAVLAAVLFITQAQIDETHNEQILEKIAFRILLGYSYYLKFLGVTNVEINEAFIKSFIRALSEDYTKFSEVIGVDSLECNVTENKDWHIPDSWYSPNYWGHIHDLMHKKEPMVGVQPPVDMWHHPSTTTTWEPQIDDIWSSVMQPLDDCCPSTTIASTPLPEVEGDNEISLIRLCSVNPLLPECKSIKPEPALCEQYPELLVCKLFNKCIVNPHIVECNELCENHMDLPFCEPEPTPFRSVTLQDCMNNMYLEQCFEFCADDMSQPFCDKLQISTTPFTPMPTEAVPEYDSDNMENLIQFCINTPHAPQCLEIEPTPDLCRHYPQLIVCRHLIALESCYMNAKQKHCLDLCRQNDTYSFCSDFTVPTMPVEIEPTRPSGQIDFNDCILRPDLPECGEIKPNFELCMKYRQLPICKIWFKSFIDSCTRNPRQLHCMDMCGKSPDLPFCRDVTGHYVIASKPGSTDMPIPIHLIKLCIAAPHLPQCLSIQPTDDLCREYPQLIVCSRQVTMIPGETPTVSTEMPTPNHLIKLCIAIPHLPQCMRIRPTEELCRKYPKLIVCSVTDQTPTLPTEMPMPINFIQLCIVKPHLPQCMSIRPTEELCRKYPQLIVCSVSDQTPTLPTGMSMPINLIQLCIVRPHSPQCMSIRPTEELCRKYPQLIVCSDSDQTPTLPTEMPMPINLIQLCIVRPHLPQCMSIRPTEELCRKYPQLIVCSVSDQTPTLPTEMPMPINLIQLCIIRPHLPQCMSIRPTEELCRKYPQLIVCSRYITMVPGQTPTLPTEMPKPLNLIQICIARPYLPQCMSIQPTEELCRKYPQLIVCSRLVSTIPEQTPTLSVDMAMSIHLIKLCIAVPRLPQCMKIRPTDDLCRNYPQLIVCSRPVTLVPGKTRPTEMPMFNLIQLCITRPHLPQCMNIRPTEDLCRKYPQLIVCSQYSTTVSDESLTRPTEMPMPIHLIKLCIAIPYLPQCKNIRPTEELCRNYPQLIVCSRPDSIPDLTPTMIPTMPPSMSLSRLIQQCIITPYLPQCLRIKATPDLCRDYPQLIVCSRPDSIPDLTPTMIPTMPPSMSLSRLIQQCIITPYLPQCLRIKATPELCRDYPQLIVCQQRKPSEDIERCIANPRQAICYQLCARNVALPFCRVIMPSRPGIFRPAMPLPRPGLSRPIPIFFPRPGTLLPRPRPTPSEVTGSGPSITITTDIFSDETLRLCSKIPNLPQCLRIKPTPDVCRKYPELLVCKTMVTKMWELKLAECNEYPTLPQCSGLCAINKDLPFCPMQLQPVVDLKLLIPMCLKRPYHPHCLKIQPSPEICRAYPQLIVCRNEIENQQMESCFADATQRHCLALCVKNKSLPFCIKMRPTSWLPSSPAPSIESLIQICILRPSLPQCSRIRPTLELCTRYPQLLVCNDCMQKPKQLKCLEQCEENKSLPFCGLISGEDYFHVCTLMPNLPRCLQIKPSEDICRKYPQLLVCKKRVISWHDCVTNPSLPYCVSLCQENPKLPFCPRRPQLSFQIPQVEEDISTLCIRMPNLPNCVRLKKIQECKDNPKLPYCAELCAENKLLPFCIASSSTGIWTTAEPFQDSWPTPTPGFALGGGLSIASICLANPNLPQCLAIQPTPDLCKRYPQLVVCKRWLQWWNALMTKCAINPGQPDCLKICMQPIPQKPAFCQTFFKEGNVPALPMIVGGGSIAISGDAEGASFSQEVCMTAPVPECQRFCNDNSDLPFCALFMIDDFKVKHAMCLRNPKRKVCFEMCMTYPKLPFCELFTRLPADSAAFCSELSFLPQCDTDAKDSTSTVIIRPGEIGMEQKRTRGWYELWYNPGHDEKTGWVLVWDNKHMRGEWKKK